MTEAPGPYEGSGVTRGDEALLTILLSRWRRELCRRPDARPRSHDRADCDQLLLAYLLRASERETDTSLPALTVAAQTLCTRVICSNSGRTRRRLQARATPRERYERFGMT